MIIKITYIGTLNGIHGIWCGFLPEGVIVEKEINVYYPDEGKVFTKDGELFDSVVLQEGESIEEYTEIVDPRPQPEPIVEEVQEEPVEEESGSEEEVLEEEPIQEEE